MRREGQFVLNPFKNNPDPPPDVHLMVGRHTADNVQAHRAASTSGTCARGAVIGASTAPSRIDDLMLLKSNMPDEVYTPSRSR